jgi:Na+/proline symporter
MVGVFMLAAIMSTLDSQLYVAMSSLTRWIEKTSNLDRRFVKTSRIVLISLILILGIITIGISDIVTFLFGAVTLGTTLFVPLLLCLTNRNKSRFSDTFLAYALAIAGIVYTIFFFTGAFERLAFTLIPSGIVALLTCIMFLIERNEPQPRH